MAMPREGDRVRCRDCGASVRTLARHQREQHRDGGTRHSASFVCVWCENFKRIGSIYDFRSHVRKRHVEHETLVAGKHVKHFQLCEKESKLREPKAKPNSEWDETDELVKSEIREYLKRTSRPAAKPRESGSATISSVISVPTTSTVPTKKRLSVEDVYTDTDSDFCLSLSPSLSLSPRSEYHDDDDATKREWKPLTSGGMSSARKREGEVTSEVINKRKRSQVEEDEVEPGHLDLCHVDDRVIFSCTHKDFTGYLVIYFKAREILQDIRNKPTVPEIARAIDAREDDFVPITWERRRDFKLAVARHLNIRHGVIAKVFFFKKDVVECETAASETESSRDERNITAPETVASHYEESYCV